MGKTFLISLIKNIIFISVIVTPLLLYYLWVSINPQRTTFKMDIEEAKKRFHILKNVMFFKMKEILHVIVLQIYGPLSIGFVEKLTKKSSVILLR